MKKIILSICIAFSLAVSAANISKVSRNIKNLDELEENEDYLSYLEKSDAIIKKGKLNQDEYFALLLGRTRVLVSLGEIEEAYKNLKGLKSFTKENIDYQVKYLEMKAQLKLMEGKKNESSQLCSKAIEINKLKNKTVHLSCLLKIASMENESKLDDFNRAIGKIARNSFKDQVNAYLNLAYLYGDRGENEKALVILERLLSQPSIEKTKEYIAILVFQGGLLQKMGRDNSSKNVFKKILKLKPKTKFNERMIVLANVEVEKLNHNYEKAFQWLKKLFLITPTVHTDSKSSLENYSEVIIEQNVEKFTRDDLYFMLSKLELYFKDEDLIFINSGVLDLFKRIYNLYPDKRKLQDELNARGIFVKESKLSKFFWGNFYLDRNDTVTSGNIFNALAKEYPDSPLGWGGLQNVTTKEGKYIESIDYYRKAKTLAGKDVWVSYLQTPLLRLYDYAMKALSVGEVELLGTQIVKLVPEYENVVHATLGHFYYDKESYELAEKEFKESIATIKSKDAAHQDEPYIMLGNIDFKKGKILEAKENYQKALNVKQNSRYALLGLGEVYRYEANEKMMHYYYDRAIKCSKDALRIITDSRGFEEGVYSKANFELGEFYEKKRKVKLADQYYKKATLYGYEVQRNAAREKLKKILKLGSFK